MFILTACGGGGGGTPSGISISPDNNTVISNNIISNIGAIDHALQTLTSVNGISATSVDKSKFKSRSVLLCNFYATYFNRNDEELKFLNSERAQMDSQMMAQQISNNSSPLDVNDGPVDENIRGEILQLKQRLAGTDLELQRTNTTLRYVTNIDQNK